MPDRSRQPSFTANGRWIGASVPRREDDRLLRGAGIFVDDIAVTGLLHAQFVRSQHAAASIERLDIRGALAVPGVVAALTAVDLAAGDLIAELERPPEEFTPTAMPILARDQVRFVGEPIAIIVATDPYAAEDGVDAVDVEYSPRTAVIDDIDARRVGATPVHDVLRGNVYLDVTMFASDEIDDTFADAECIVRVQTKTGRQHAVPLETRGIVASWDHRKEQLLVDCCTQVPHQLRTAIARCLDVAESTVRVSVPDMGGGFGLKSVVGREEVAAAAAALRLRRPVKWIEDRRDSLHASFLAREQRYDVRAAFDADGRILGLDADIVCDMGAYSCYPFTAGVEPLMASAELPGVYRVPLYRVRGRAVATNKAPSAPYRGVSRPQIVMVMERLFERAARELNIDPLDLRRRNLIANFPYTGINGVTYDPGSYLESLNLCEATVRDEGWEDLRAAAASEGRLVGIGYSCFNERTGYGSDAFAKRKMTIVPGFDISEVRMDPSGAVTATSGTQNHGQGHETTLAQIVADKLQIDISRVRIVQGDTDRIVYGWGTYASRSTVIGGGAISVAASRLAERMLAIAAQLLDCDPADLDLDDGKVRHRTDPSRSMTYEAIAEIAYLRSHLLPKEVPPGLSATGSFDVAGDGTFSNGTHAAMVEVDRGTGRISILGYICVEDCGVQIHPHIVEGQCRGGIAQGIAGALFEEMTYESNGEPHGTSFMDYKVPTALEIPEVRILHLETPCAFTETGAKGVGEGGTIGAPAALINAVNDAIRETGAELNNTPIRSEDVWQALHGSNGGIAND